MAAQAQDQKKNVTHPGALGNHYRLNKQDASVEISKSHKKRRRVASSPGPANDHNAKQSRVNGRENECRKAIDASRNAGGGKRMGFHPRRETDFKSHDSGNVKRAEHLQNKNGVKEEIASETGSVMLSNNLRRLLKHFSEGKKWFEVDGSTFEQDKKQIECKDKDSAVAFLKKEAAELAARLERAFPQKRGEERLFKDALEKGTAADMLAAHVLLIQQCPLAHAESIRVLLKLAAKPNRRQASMACDALKDLLINDLLPDSRKLVFFDAHPRLISLMTPVKKGTHVHVNYSDSELVSLWFEDFVKTCYANFVLILASGVADPLSFFKRNTMKFVFELLAACPEQEKGLLSLLVSKLMDRVPKDASTAAFYLGQLVSEHPPMRGVICFTIASAVREQLSSVSAADTAPAIYQAVLFLSQVRYKKSDGAFAKLMVDVFLTLFRKLITVFQEKSKRKDSRAKTLKKLSKKRKKARLAQDGIVRPPDHCTGHNSIDTDSSIRLLRAVLNGLNRAVPYVDSKDLPSSLDDDLKALEQLAQRVTSWTTKVAILSLYYRLVTILQRDYTSLLQLVYNEMRHFGLLRASNRRVFLLLLRHVAKSQGVDLSVILSLYRRLEQIGCHDDAPAMLAQITEDLVAFLARHRSWATPLLKATEALLLADLLDETFRDAEEPKESNQLATPATVSAPDQELPVYKGYNPRSGNPRYARSDATRLWELEFLGASINPSVAAYGQAVLRWNLTKSSESPPTLRQVMPFEKSKSGQEDVPKDVFSSASFLGLFAYRQEKAGAEAGLGSLLPNCPEYWDTKKRIYPYEKFMATYFQDALVRHHAMRRQPKLAGRANGAENDDDDDDEVDAFLDRELAKELGDSVMDDDEEFSTAELLSSCDSLNETTQEMDRDAIADSHDDDFGHDFSESDMEKEEGDDATSEEKRHAAVDGSDVPRTKIRGSQTHQQNKKRQLARAAVATISGSFAAAEDFEHMID